jgi:hypothetical protein
LTDSTVSGTVSIWLAMARTPAMMVPSVKLTCTRMVITLSSYEQRIKTNASISSRAMTPATDILPPFDYV